MTSLRTLESKARRHWNEFLPSMVASLKAARALSTIVSSSEAAETGAFMADGKQR